MRAARSKKSPFPFLLLLLLLLLLILQWTYRDSVLSSDARFHVNPIHFLARRAVGLRLLGNSTQSKSKFHHQTYSKLTSTTSFSHTESAGNVTSVKRHSVPRTWKSRDSRARARVRRTFDVLNYGYNLIIIFA